MLTAYLTALCSPQKTLCYHFRISRAQNNCLAFLTEVPMLPSSFSAATLASLVPQPRNGRIPGHGCRESRCRLAGEGALSPPRRAVLSRAEPSRAVLSRAVPHRARCLRAPEPSIHPCPFSYSCIHPRHARAMRAAPPDAAWQWRMIYSS